ncbi:MAG: ATP-binding cassette domain-containing protein, partial [Pseudomonadota bacterium]
MRRFSGRVAVEDVSLTVAPGQITCLLGPSGCGKSTTLRLVAGVERQDAGIVRVDGRPVSGDIAAHRQVRKQRKVLEHQANAALFRRHEPSRSRNFEV